jgi:tRNA-(ms[2]io[6]A)-hydroxylase
LFSPARIPATGNRHLDVEKVGLIQGPAAAARRTGGKQSTPVAALPPFPFSSPFPSSRTRSTVLHLQSDSAIRWLAQVDANLDEILIDHAHCERKAASVAMNLINAYTEDRELCSEMSVIVTEELEHFEMVLRHLDARGIRFRRLPPGPYGRQLNGLIRTAEPDRGVDRLLVAGLIEARSCERFRLLSQHVSDTELAEFYAGLFESEARHHTTYIRLAEHFAPRAVVRQRLEQLSADEAQIIANGSPLPRMHS